MKSLPLLLLQAATSKMAPTISLNVAFIVLIVISFLFGSFYG
jgi:hypothetical protein